MGFNRIVYNHLPGVCKLVKGIEAGSEDIELVSDGTILVSSGYIPNSLRVDGMPRGHIYSLTIDRLEEEAAEVLIKGNFDPRDLHPHGFSLYEDDDTGEAYLFVVNHLVGHETIEVFQYERETRTMTHIRTDRNPLFTSLNDIVALAPNQYYVTNDGYNLADNLQYVEHMLRLPWGNVVYCEVDECRRVSGPLLVPNGIALSRDGRYVYVTLIFDGILQIYERDRNDYSFVGKKPIQEIQLGSSPDNLYVDVRGDLWIGSHPSLYRAYGYFGGNTLEAPAQVLRIRFHGSKVARYRKFDIDEVFSQEGGNITWSSVAIYHRNHLFIGTVMGRMAYCTVEAFYTTCS
ncbi:serum paraoxonase/arylesterase 2-like [Diadema antillarum]|uniref:serum paraoxonase/arylesterase 2-like n=1 Tax=Diadema antillarum TaxID=105358 RepID=UPI003A89BA3E